MLFLQLLIVLAVFLGSSGTENVHLSRIFKRQSAQLVAAEYCFVRSLMISAVAGQLEDRYLAILQLIRDADLVAQANTTNNAADAYHRAEQELKQVKNKNDWQKMAEEFWKTDSRGEDPMKKLFKHASLQAVADLI